MTEFTLLDYYFNYKVGFKKNQDKKSSSKIQQQKSLYTINTSKYSTSMNY